MRTPDSKAGIVLLFALVVIASGCGESGNQSDVSIQQTSGVQVNDFSVTPSEVFSGGTANLQMEIQNKGGQKATEVRAQLFNVPIGDKGWTITEGEDPASFQPMRPANPETDQPSLSRRKTWSLEAPTVGSQMETPYDFKTRVYYHYNTKATTNVKIMNNLAFRNSDVSTSTPEIDNTGGPIQMEVRTRTPIVFYSGGDQEAAETTQFCVLVKNEGAGTTFDFGDAYSDGSYSVTRDEINYLDVEVESQGSSVSFEDNSEEVFLGTEGTCFNLEADFVSSNEIERTIPITITADYGYYVEDQTRAVVKGQPG